MIENALLRQWERQRMDDLSEQVEQLDELDRLRQVLLATVSHELRTPLTIITGASSTILERGDTLEPDQRQALLSRLHANATSLESVVARLLDYTQIKEGRLRPHMRPVQLHALIHGATRRLESLFERHELSTNVHEPLVVSADPELIERCVENLLTNAVRHTPPGTLVAVEARPTGQGDVVVSVTDDGPGIPADDVRHLGEPFFKTGRPGGGLGLGLALTKEILRRHGSDLQVDTLPRGGTRFSFVLQGQ